MFYVTRDIGKNLQTAIDFATEIADGNFDASCELRQKDEIGVLADAFRIIRNRIKDLLAEMENLTAKIEIGRMDFR